MKAAALTLALALSCGSAFGQAPPAAPAAPATPATPAASDKAPSRGQIITELVTAGVAAARKGVPGPGPFQTQFGTGGRQLIAMYLVAAHADRQGYKALLDALEARGSKQVGSTPASKGTTSLAMKGLTPKILGLAVETGAITREVDGTTLTFRATPVGVIKALQNEGLLSAYADYARSPLQRYLSRISVAASFDASKGPSAGTFAADEHQLTNWSLRSEIINQRDPASPAYAGLWSGLQKKSAEYVKATETINEQLSTWPEYVAWEKKLQGDTATRVEAPMKTNPDVDAAGARFRGLLESAMPQLEKLPNMPPNVLDALDAYVVQLKKLQTSIDAVYDFVGKGNLLTFDWSTARDASLPDLYTATGVWERSIGAARTTDLTVNGAVSFYRSKPAADGHRLKSIDITAQLEHPLGDALIVFPAATVSLAARYSHLPNDTLAAAPAPSSDVAPAPASATVPAASPKGNIGLVQFKLTVPVKNTGMKIPLSITASNRTELIKEKDVRASIGITFDLDAFVGGLFAKQ